MENHKFIKSFNNLLSFAEQMVKRYPNSPWIYEDGNKVIKEAKQLKESEIDDKNKCPKCELYSLHKTIVNDIKYCWNCGYKENKKFTGFATIKKDSKLILAGHRLKILSLYSILKDGIGIYPDNTRQFKICLKGTEFEKLEPWKNHPYCFIYETEIEKLELNSKMNDTKNL